MCRLMYMPKGIRPPQKALLSWMQDLTKSQGGDGIGYATIKGGSVKGVKLTEEDCAKALSSTKDAFVWHTRWVSCGGKTDELCHPFTAGKGWLVHNGTWSTGVFTASLLKGDYSDTAVAALAINVKGWDYFARNCYQGVWLQLTKKGCRVLYRSGSLYVETKTGALCSEPCREWGKWRKAEEGQYSEKAKIDLAKDTIPSIGFASSPIVKNGSSAVSTTTKSYEKYRSNYGTAFSTPESYGDYLARWKETP